MEVHIEESAFVTGGAGFIGSTVCERLLSLGVRVTSLDNFSSGSEANVRRLLRNPQFHLVRGDCKSLGQTKKALADADTVIHLSANPEVRLDRADPTTCFEENVLATQTILEAMVHSKARTLIFASSSTVYGDAKVLPTPEEYSPLFPISVYGATKLASEALATGYANSFGFDLAILRLANIIGPRSRHGIIPDFINKLTQNPKSLEILGDGTQRKSYLYVDDCVEALLRVASNIRGIGVYNVGSSDQVGVTEIADEICHQMDIHPAYKHTGGVDGGRGWIGDVKNMQLDVGRLRAQGWTPRDTSLEAVSRTVREYLSNVG